ncbi:MAG: TatD family hydrolase [Candidatus Binatota bacterium]
MLIDAHAHLDNYGAELQPALEEIEKHEIFTIAVSMDLPSYQRSLEIADMCDLVLPTFGVHPKRAPEYAGSLSELSPFIERSPMIGEIGLDFHWVKDPSQYPPQRKVLEYFLAAAREQRKIVNLHTKGAEKEILNLLERYDIQRPIIHWYSGPLDIFRSLVDYGAYFTVGVEVFSSENIQAIAREVPEGQLLTETDNPGGLKWLRGVIGLPVVIEKVVQVIAALRQSTTEAIERTVYENFTRLIEDDPWLADVRARVRD